MSVKWTKGFQKAVKDARATRPKYPHVMRYAGKAYVMDRCTGEAHANPYIDNCGECAPLWGVAVRTLADECTSFTDWLESTLIRDLRESGSDATAEDFERCVTLIRALLECGK